MSQSIIAIRYAKGLALFAREQGEISLVREDLGRLVDLLDPDRGNISVPELLDFLHSPTVPQKEKIHITDVICDELSIGSTVSNFLNVLIRKKRISLVSLIARQYERIAGQMESVHVALVRTAAPLSPAQELSLAAAMSAATGTEVRLEVKTDSTLVAGLSVRLGDQLMDGSVAGRLDRLKAKLTAKD